MLIFKGEQNAQTQFLDWARSVPDRALRGKGGAAESQQALERSLTSREHYKANRAAALAEWRGLLAA